MSRRFRLGVIGAGQIVQTVHLPVLEAMPEVELAWITDASDDRARRVGADYGVPHLPCPADPRQLPADVDAVLLATPTHVREAYYRALAEHGTAVLAEKPFALRHGPHEAWRGLFAEHRLGVGYMRRYYRNVEILRRAVASGAFGPLRAVRHAEGGRAGRTGFDENFKDRAYRDGGGILLAIGCHALDEVVFVTAPRAFHVLDADLVFDGDTDRRVDATIRLDGCGSEASSCELRFTVSWLDPQDNVLELRFDRATLSTGMAPDASVLVRPAGDGPAWTVTSPGGAVTSYQAFCLEWRDFLRGVAERRATRISAVESSLTVRLMDTLMDGVGKAVP